MKTMKTIKDCVNYLVTPNLTGSVTYLDFEASAKSPAELSLKINQKHLELEAHTSTAQLTKEQVDAIKSIQENLDKIKDIPSNSEKFKQVINAGAYFGIVAAS